MTVVDSPPGTTSPSTDASCARRLDRGRLRARALECDDVLGDVALDRQDADAAGSVAAHRQHRRLGQRAQVDAAHRLGAGQRFRRFHDGLRIVEMRVAATIAFA